MAVAAKMATHGTVGVGKCGKGMWAVIDASPQADAGLARTELTGVHFAGAAFTQVALL